MKVKDLLNQKDSKIYSIDSKSTVYDAIKMMSEKGIGALLVIDNGSLNGIISERDYRDKVILKGRRSKDTPVKQIMTEQLYTVNSNDDIRLCMRIMTDRKIRHLPVLDNDKLSGIISIGDVVKTIIDRQKGEIDSLRNYIAGERYPG